MNGSRLSFVAQGRTRRLYRQTPTGPFYVRFQYRGKDTPRCLGTTDANAAKERARQIIDAVFNEQAETSRALKLRNDYALLSEICAIYLQRYGQDARRRRTANGNVGALQKIVRVSGIPWPEARANVLTAELVRAFEATEARRIERDSRGNMLQESEVRIRTSVSSWLKQARSIFKRSTLSWYGALPLPDLTGFRVEGVTPAERPKPRPLDPGVFEAMNAAAPALAAADPACYMAHLLFSRLGMRNGEIKAARRSWIVRTPAGGKLGVIYRPAEGFKPKKRTERWIPVGPATLAELDARYIESPDGDYLVPGPNKTVRAATVDRRHSQWCGQWIRDRVKVSYELRRQAGSLVFQKTKSLAHVQAFLGHADLKTTTDWYWYLIEELPALDESDFASAPSLAA